jgi:pSer/pThr/pTyr-binding forkhead associated (FHA) protein
MDRTTEDPDKGPSYLVYEFERRAYPLSTNRFTIGRDATSDIIVREPAVSRSHAEVTLENGDYMLRSVGATGTMLNGASLGESARLEDGDTIGVGSMEFTFRRGRLPLGVSVVDTLSTEGHDPDAMTKRDTIKSPILGGGQTPPAKKATSFPTGLALLVLLLAAAVYLFFTRR